MSHDQPYLLAEKKIKQTLKSGVTELPIRHPFFCSLSVENKGGKYGS
jgi:hypothetical protein